MVREQYPVDKFFEEVLGYVPDLSPELQEIDQATRRVLQRELVPATEKIVSLFEEHTDIICRGKEAKEPAKF